MGALWHFSLDFYAQPGVAPACLRCQDEAGADVNLILFLLWQAGSGAQFTPAEITAIDRNVSEWREQAILPLRAVRRFLKGRDREGLRDQVQAAELEAERIQQEKLSCQAREVTEASAAEAASTNLQAYETVLGQTLPRQAVAALLTAFNWSRNERV